MFKGKDQNRPRTTLNSTNQQTIKEKCKNRRSLTTTKMREKNSQKYFPLQKTYLFRDT